MFFRLYRETITLLQSQKGVAKENQEAERYYFKHMYMSGVISSLIMNPFLSFIIAGVSLLGGVFFGILFLKFKVILFAGFAMILYIPGIIVGLTQFKVQKLQNKGKQILEIQEKLIDKMLNIYTINPCVISFFDWIKLKLASKKNYETIRSFKSINECYRTTFYIANIVKKDRIKIIWILYTDFYSGKKCGHAVLTKGNWIYDSNTRKTYPKLEYLETIKAEVFKELSLKEYLYDNVEELKQEELAHQEAMFESMETDYDDFKVFCTERNGTRDSNDTEL